MRTHWIKTDKHVYGAIYREHKDYLKVFGSFSNPEPSELSQEPQMMTEWGFQNSDGALIKHRMSWDYGNRDHTENHEYWIAAHSEDAE